ncbi:uncharacterized protein PgNI_07241 [Pyricularia grisea]|uniref:Uncharacterized protein n=1 Tax=Pyricularia grisea TaxID=148305 RepID=A0A6P8B0J0_PYRGI|nr:uncharacterized protein PgNI_07241 [Pyricularia grisea]TLD08233.1 hypothetical protein PgNI_07241 [Pyricularia grisea]
MAEDEVRRMAVTGNNKSKRDSCGGNKAASLSIIVDGKDLLYTTYIPYTEPPMIISSSSSSMKPPRLAGLTRQTVGSQKACKRKFRFRRGTGSR